MPDVSSPRAVRMLGLPVHVCEEATGHNVSGPRLPLSQDETEAGCPPKFTAL